MPDLTIDADGTLLIDGQWRPIVMLSQRVRDGGLDIESRQPQEGSEVEHVIGGWTVRRLAVRLQIYERDGRRGERWTNLAVLREAQTRRRDSDPRLPVVWSLNGELAVALDLHHVLITGLDDIEIRRAQGDIQCTLELIETNPSIAVVTAQVAVGAAAAPTAPAPDPGPESRELLDEVAANWGGEY